MDDPTDRDLLLRIQDGGKDAFALLFDRYNRMLCRYARYLLKDRSAAEDVVQDVFAMMMARPAVAQNIQSLRFWLLRVVRNRCLAISHSENPISVADDFNIVWETTTPLDDAERRDVQKLVRDAVGRLKSIYREVIVLREFDGMTYAEIAQVLEEPLSTVKFRLFKAREALAGLLGPIHRERNLS